MIGMCRAQFPNYDWRVGDMRTLSLDRTFNGILAWNSFFHLCHDDQRRMFPIFRKHSASRAALMFTSGPSHSEAIGKLEGEPLYHASLDPSELSRLIEGEQFRGGGARDRGPRLQSTYGLACAAKLEPGSGSFPRCQAK